MKTRQYRAIYALAVAVGIAPLWAGRQLPLVDLPQHLHLISVLHRLNDPSTIYPRLFELRGQLTPYWGYYYAVDLLNWLLPLEVANKVFLAAYIAGLPLSLAFLLRSFHRPSWPSLLSLPFAYGDSFWWGFINFCSALPLTFLSIGLFARVIEEADIRARRLFLLATCLVAVLLFHVQLYAYLGLALPAVLLMTRGAEGKGWFRQRLPAVLSVLPSAVLFLVWIVARLGEPTPVDRGAPWKAWGPMLSKQNLSFKTFDQNLSDLFQVLANSLRDHSDRWAIYCAAAIAAAGWVVFAANRSFSRSSEEVEHREGRLERWRLLALGAGALAMFFALPFDIRGYIYYLNTRYAHVAAPLLVSAVPPLHRWSRGFLSLAAVNSLVMAVPLALGVSRFNVEASALEQLAPHLRPASMIMGLIFNPMSAVVAHPVFLHSAAVLARERGGATNFSFASTPHSPVKYRGNPPPSFPSEWRPDQFEYQRYGYAYDYFLLRGPPPERVFGARLNAELELVDQAGSFWLIRRR